MGAAAVTALATAVIPYGLQSKTEGDLQQMMAGAVGALSEAGCRLVGGHTCEGAELALGAPPTVESSPPEGQLNCILWLQSMKPQPSSAAWTGLRTLHLIFTMRLRSLDYLH